MILSMRCCVVMSVGVGVINGVSEPEDQSPEDGEGIEVSGVMEKQEGDE